MDHQIPPMETELARARGPLSHVCFVAPATWPVLTGDRSIRMVGGAEVQQSTIARALVRRGHRVSMVCMDFGQPRKVLIDGIEVLRAHTPKGGVPILRFLHPRLTSLWGAMARADADIYYQRTCGGLTGIVAAFCRRHSRAFLYAAAHDADFEPQLPLIRYRRDKALYRWGLHQADAIVVQTSAQEESCRRVFGLPSRRIPSCHAVPPNATRDPMGYVLWVSTMRSWKRPELFIEVARCLPQFKFRMVGGPDDPQYFEALRHLAASLPNLEFAGFIPYADVDAQFDGARLLVNTSESEGFPNTFLQAWARGIPTVSFLDSGWTVSGVSVMQVARSLDEMVALVVALMTDDARWSDAGAHSRKYFDQYHSLDRVAAAYGTLISDVLSVQSPRQRPSTTR